MRLHRLILLVVSSGLLSSALVCVTKAQQQEPGAPKPRTFVDFVAANNIVVSPGHSAPVQFTFHVQDPYHINSSQPLTEELIPTQLHFSLPPEVAFGKLQYPAGKLMSFPFDPSTKLSVYSGDFVIKGIVLAPGQASSGIYTVHAELKYQACDNNACYPPKKLPFAFNVKVGSGGKSVPKARPTKTSPHIHN
ncbi:MAG TPA: protein-disulfide reductase DsbD domain-containing protein [Candidatus Angelobacter sp.]|nr:protein-disulfide reductase DsbD domain-containing protein [Candidatus Angelobacter sp.]